jgi:hypothetical protein
MLSAALAEARPLGVADGEATLAFPARADFLRRTADKDDHRRIAADALRALSGASLRLRYELSDDDSAPADAPAVSDAELVDRFVSAFDAEELIDDEEGA